jgi:ribosomal protein S27AE
MEKVFMIEEVSPESGYTKEEIEKNIWNSPPPVKGEGRYLIRGNKISQQDFSQMKEKNLVSYWSYEFLDDVDMFYARPGWRTNAAGIRFLKEKGYEVEIETLAMQAEKVATAKKARQEVEEKRKKTLADNAREYLAEIEAFEVWLGNPVWVGDAEKKRRGTGELIELKTIRSKNSTDYNDEYISYYLTPAGYIHCFRHHNSDWWEHLYSEKPASEEIVQYAQEEKKKMEKERQEETERRKKEQEEKVFFSLVCPRCGRHIYASKIVQNMRCGKCHTGGKATKDTTVAFSFNGEVKRKDIPERAEIKYV